MNKDHRAYFNHLLKLTNVPKNYTKLCEIMHKIQFIWDAKNYPMDQSRMGDGFEPRRCYSFNVTGRLDAKDEFYEGNTGGCSFYEFVHGLAFRLTYLYYWEIGPNFMELLKNAGFDVYENQYIAAHPEAENEIFEKCQWIMTRQFDACGHGSLLTKEHPNKPFNCIDWWWMLNYYSMH